MTELSWLQSSGVAMGYAGYAVHKGLQAFRGPNRSGRYIYVSKSTNYETAENPDIMKYTHQMRRISVLCSSAYVYFVMRLISPLGMVGLVRLTGGLIFYHRCFFSKRDLRAPSAVKLCHIFGSEASTKLYCLVTEAHVCEQLAQGCTYLAVHWAGLEPATSGLQVRHDTAIPPSHKAYLLMPN